MPLHDLIAKLPEHNVPLSTIYDPANNLLGSYLVRETPFASGLQAWLIETTAFVSKHGRSDTSGADSPQAWRVLLADHHKIENPCARQPMERATSRWGWWNLTSAIFVAISSMNITGCDHFAETDVVFQDAVREELRNIQISFKEEEEALQLRGFPDFKTISILALSLFGQTIRNAYRRRVFATDNGYLGLGPDSIRDGDIVAVLYGQITPLVLRPTANGCYTLLGDAHVDGIMHGEIMETSLTITTFSIV